VCAAALPGASQPSDAQAENQYLRDPLAAVLGDGKQNRDQNPNRNFD
jgi:hypothetical protein